MLALIAARSGTGFVRFIATITDPFYAPFRGIVESPTTDGGKFRLAPPPDTRLEPGTALIVLGHAAELARVLRPLAANGPS